MEGWWTSERYTEKLWKTPSPTSAEKLVGPKHGVQLGEPVRQQSWGDGSDNGNGHGNGDCSGNDASVRISENT